MGLWTSKKNISTSSRNHIVGKFSVNLEREIIKIIQQNVSGGGGVYGGSGTLAPNVVATIPDTLHFKYGDFIGGSTGASIYVGDLAALGGPDNSLFIVSGDGSSGTNSSLAFTYFAGDQLTKIESATADAGKTATTQLLGLSYAGGNASVEVLSRTQFGASIASTLIDSMNGNSAIPGTVTIRNQNNAGTFNYVTVDGDIGMGSLGDININTLDQGASIFGEIHLKSNTTEITVSNPHITINAAGATTGDVNIYAGALANTATISGNQIDLIAQDINLNPTGSLNINGTPGANFSGAVTNITVVDGIVTAVS